MGKEAVSTRVGEGSAGEEAATNGGERVQAVGRLESDLGCFGGTAVRTKVTGEISLQFRADPYE